ncbi:helix-turn-helix domain-containing protein [Streptomyces beijiangensis]|uniref:Helix-turn-helix transcriptional regulator n=1 Tax=Streptomyces beijiangensis TaxID=163361 RepID=A0A939F5K3_9ACTN|nr:helix-turn-helix transcriptional regulator [Streptomyces beijiangensis]MBO0511904.1 helix-turn-helix transcriptional regulator [Streptomyces beijiangensis]
MLERPQTFGSALRRARLSAGLTLAQLSDRVHYSKGQLSKVETGHKRPTEELARLCDGQLDADGVLLALLPRPASTDNAAGGPEYAGSPPRPHTVGRRDVMTTGMASALGLAAFGGTAAPQGTADGTLLDVWQSLFDQFRRLGQSAPPAAVLPALAEQTRALRALAARSGPRTGRCLIALCARYAEFAGWMAQESGDVPAAQRWTDHAVDLADAAGETELASYALVRRGLIAYYKGDAADTIALARAVPSRGTPARVLGLAAQREAQGHALTGDYGACMRALDRARVHLSHDAMDTDRPVLGTTHLADPVAMVTAWSLLDLGRPVQAAAALDTEMAHIPPGALRTRARYGTRQALAHALSGEIRHACELSAQLMDAAHLVDSSTIAHDLRRLARVLGRHPSHPSVHELSPLLTFVLSPASPLS